MIEPDALQRIYDLSYLCLNFAYLPYKIRCDFLLSDLKIDITSMQEKKDSLRSSASNYREIMKDFTDNIVDYIGNKDNEKKP